MALSHKTIIGRVAIADFPTDKISGVPVKIDTGADSSSIWATSIHIDDKHRLCFSLFSPDSPFYTGKVHKKTNYTPKMIRVASGHMQIRYSVKLSIKLDGRRILGTFTLADRSKNSYPVLVGCRLLKNKFLVDVAMGNLVSSRHKSVVLQKEFRRDPKAFFDKYHLDNERGDVDL